MPKYSRNAKSKNKKPWVESTNNIYRDLCFSDEDAANALLKHLARLSKQVTMTFHDSNQAA
jgi:hypothetical protein